MNQMGNGHVAPMTTPGKITTLVISVLCWV